MTDALISSFRGGHIAIKVAISELQPMVRSYRHVKPKLPIFQEIILTHVERQDEQLFSRLELGYAHNREKMKIVEFLRQDLKDFKVQFLIFFEKHSGEILDYGSRSFPKDFQDYVHFLLARISMEEEYLLPLLQNLDLGAE